jgi:D-inositol-3-phosphate glycosyltransferase
MKIAIIEPIGAYGGMEIYDISILEGLSKKSTFVHLYTSSYFNDLQCVPLDNINTIFGRIYSKEINRWWRLLYFFKGLFLLSMALRNNQYDVKYCHIFTYSFVELLIITVARIGPGRLFINIHDPEPFINNSNQWIKKIFNKILCSSNISVVTHSEYSKSVLVNNFERITPRVMPHTDIDYIYTPPSASKAGSRKALGLREDGRFILFFGQIKPNKGLDILIKAFAASKIFNKGFKLLISGRCWGESWDRYEKIINENLLSEFVIVQNNYIPAEYVYHYFKSCDYVVLPYTQIFSSGVLIRAMGYGRPVVCSDLPAFLEEVVDGENGIVFESGNVDSLADALVKVASSDELVNEMTYKVNQHYSLKYDRHFVGEKMLKVFNDE